ncbi:MAG: ACT domain-containing protein, partial [Candidatus Hinthialibacter sp.]
MAVRQISVFLENRAGRMAEVTQILGENGVNIRAVSLADTHDFGIVRLIVNDVEQALSILQAKQFTVHDTEVIAVSIPDEPGGLAKTLNLFSRENVNISYLYGFVEKPGSSAILI